MRKNADSTNYGTTDKAAAERRKAATGNAMARLMAASVKYGRVTEAQCRADGFGELLDAGRKISA